jgi:hypothetical protein
MAQTIADRINRLVHKGIRITELNGAVNDNTLVFSEWVRNYEPRLKETIGKFESRQQDCEGTEFILGIAKNMDFQAEKYGHRIGFPRLTLGSMELELHVIEDYQHHKTYVFNLPSRKYMRD